jgi:hypothetical protein
VRTGVRQDMHIGIAENDSPCGCYMAQGGRTGVCLLLATRDVRSRSVGEDAEGDDACGKRSARCLAVGLC